VVELAVTGPDCFLGYPDETPIGAAFTADELFLTGDHGFRDAEKCLSIHGHKDVTIRGGENISAREAEDLLFEYPALVEVAVGAMSDMAKDEKACAYLVVAPEARLQKFRLRRDAATKVTAGSGG
jgi:cyclohexanecarboxylate-CoA ligase